MNKFLAIIATAATGAISLCCSSCEKSSGEGTQGTPGAETPDIVHNDKIIVGGYSHAANIKTASPDDISYMKYPTRIYCFGTSPNVEGRWNLSQSYEYNISVMRKAMLPDQEAFLVIGGGGTSMNMYVMGTDEAKRNAYAKAMVNYAHTNGYDGIDIDWETVWSVSPALRIPPEDLAALLSKIREEMSALPSDTKVRKLTCALSSIEHDVAAAVKDYVDQINVMIYDCYASSVGEDGTYAHAPMDLYKQRLENYRNVGVPNEKIIVGVPFYGGDKKQDGTPTKTYKALYEEAEGNLAASANSFGGYAYNGPDLMVEKTKYVVEQGYAGIMVWEISQDISYDNPLSLMRAIRSVSTAD